jgi:very-short-patch-repair endonuclease
MNDEQKPSWQVTSKQRNRARALRKNLTDAERTIWTVLRGHRLNGLGFRRQFPIGPFVVDFVCHAAKLVIELDGGQHFSDAGETRDARRTALIEAKGFRILRFSNHDVMTNRTGVLETIAAALKASAPTPTLPRKRERGHAEVAAMSNNRKRRLT